MSVTLEQKNNEDFSHEFAYTDANGNAIDITDIDILMEIRNKTNGSLIASYTNIDNVDAGITKTDAIGGLYSISTSASTVKNWNIALLEADISYIDSDGRKTTETFYIEMKKGVTSVS
ncbi:MAG: hypothetical protein KDI76_14070 [Xanthomonadales bacterium]|nr:hypothetical protein [Xanthomonadales bacterium]